MPKLTPFVADPSPAGPNVAGRSDWNPPDGRGSGSAKIRVELLQAESPVLQGRKQLQEEERGSQGTKG